MSLSALAIKAASPSASFKTGRQLSSHIHKGTQVLGNMVARSNSIVHGAIPQIAYKAQGGLNVLGL
jgi:hypothetical protein